MSDSLKDNCKNTILELIGEYKENEYMLQRIQHHISNLSHVLSNEFDNFEKRKNRNDFLTKEQQIFIQVFLKKKSYYYFNNTGFFYEYDGKKFTIVKEDEIIHQLLSSISQQRILLDWKHKTKINVLKQIKERNLFDCIPESDTIQHLLKYLYPNIFETKNYAKYFLTIVGDAILRKNSNLIYLVSSQLKKIITDVENIAMGCVGINNLGNNFVTKHHENHLYDTYRLLKINTNFCTSVWKDGLKKIGLNLICVAAHYSKRHDSAESFLDNKLDDNLRIYTLFLKNNKDRDIIDDFCSKFITCSETLQLGWKDFHFLWKEYLFENNLYNIIYSASLKLILKEKYEHDDQTDVFYGITSKYLPKQREFLTFWENSVEINKAVEFDNEIEIDEICTFYKNWCKQNKETTHKFINEEMALNILKHFYPELTIFEDKYILNVSFPSWDKIKDINDSLELFKSYLKGRESIAIISFDETYGYYEKYGYTHNKLISSKRFFEKYICFKLSEHIIYDKFIQIEWINN
jgi:hypothetical protein